MIIETERLRLRPAEEKDIPLLVEAMNDWSIAQWLLSAPYPYAEPDAKWFINWTNTLDDDGFLGKFAIADLKTDLFLGAVTLVAASGRAELGYWLVDSAQKKGVMREAVAAVVDYAKKQIPNHVCFATLDPANVGSANCLAATGFKPVRTYQRETPRRNGSVDTVLYER